MRGSVRKRKDGRWEGRVELPKVDGKSRERVFAIPLSNLRMPR